MATNDERVVSRPEDRTWAEDVADVLPDAVIVVDTAASVVWGNLAAERLFGRGLDESVGVSGLDFVHPDDLELAAVSLSSVVGKQVGTPLELRVRGADGWHLVEMVGAPLGDHVVLVLRDLTERRRWELGGDEVTRFRAVLQNAAPVTLLLGEDGVVQSSSAALTRLLGVDQEWMEGRSVTELADGADRAVIADALAGLVAGPSGGSDGIRAELDVRVHRADGTVVPVALTLANLLDDPTVEGVVATLHDISRRVRAEDDLREANSLLAATLDATAEGVLVVGLEGRISSFNQPLRRDVADPPGPAGLGLGRAGDGLRHAVAGRPGRVPVPGGGPVRRSGGGEPRPGGVPRRACVRAGLATAAGGGRGHRAGVELPGRDRPPHPADRTGPAGLPRPPDRTGQPGAVPGAAWARPPAA